MSETDTPTKTKEERMGGEDDEALTKAELRGYIAKELGKRTAWHTPLDKETLNALYRYLTGEYYIPRAAVHNPNHPAFESAQDIRVAIAWEVGIIEEDPEEEWTTMTGAPPSSFRREELATIRSEMIERGSQMPMPDKPEDDGK